jgi:hypothetical protein
MAVALDENIQIRVGTLDVANGKGRVDQVVVVDALMRDLEDHQTTRGDLLGQTVEAAVQGAGRSFARCCAVIGWRRQGDSGSWPR